MRKRVVAYVTRQRGDRRELLVFEQLGDPDAGTQVPAGRLDPGETLEEGLARELEEETGLRGARVVRKLAGPEEFRRLYGEPVYENHVFHLALDGETPDHWHHSVAGTGDDAGLVFICRWVPLGDELALWHRSDPFVERLRAGARLPVGDYEGP